MDCFFIALKCRVRDFFRTFRFSRFLHVSFFKSSTFRFAGFIYILLCGKPLYPESEIQIPSPPIITSRLLMKKSEILIQLSQNEQRGTTCLWSFPFVRYIHSDYANYCQNGVAHKYPLQRFIAPSKDFERFINAAFLIYSSVWITSSTFSFNFSNGLISSFVSCIQLLIL